MLRIISFCIFVGAIIGAVAALDIIAIRKAKKITFKEDKHELY